MKEQFLKKVRDFANADISKQPRFVFIKRFYSKLLEYFPENEAVVIAANAIIDVDDSFIKDEELFQETVDSYAKVLVNLQVTFNEINPNFFWEMIKSNSNQITVRYLSNG
jgi:hypothetical protein